MSVHVDGLREKRQNKLATEPVANRFSAVWQ